MFRHHACRKVLDTWWSSWGFRGARCFGDGWTRVPSPLSRGNTLLHGLLKKNITENIDMFHSLFSECWPCKLMFCQCCCLSSSWNRDSAIFILQKWFNVIYTVLSLAVVQQPLPKFYYNGILSFSMILWSLDIYIICTLYMLYAYIIIYHISNFSSLLLSFPFC